MEEKIYISSIGQDSHRFIDCLSDKAEQDHQAGKKLVLGGIEFSDYPGLAGNSDADVILHALTNAISGLTAKPVLGKRADELCLAGDKNSASFLALALADLAEDKRSFEILHVSISIEGQRPKFAPFIDKLRQNIARLVNIKPNQVAITATTGEDLTAFGRGEGLACTCIISASYLKPKMG